MSVTKYVFLIIELQRKAGVRAIRMQGLRSLYLPRHGHVCCKLVNAFTMFASHYVVV